ncbi:hypothetical protein P3S67_015442 [Capsicum chacoense]
MYQKTDQTKHHDPHPGFIIAIHHFKEPYALVNECDLLSISTMDLLIQFAYPSLSGSNSLSCYGKFTISFTMKRTYGEEITFTLGNAIPLTHEDGKLIPMSEVYVNLSLLIRKYMEIYEGYLYLQMREIARFHHSLKGRRDIIPLKARKIRNGKRTYTSYIKELKPSSKKLKGFIVGDLETLLIDNVHTPYAVGLMKVLPGEKINARLIDTYFSEDYSIIIDSFKGRSKKLMFDFIERIAAIVRLNPSIETVYFHNFSRSMELSCLST